LSFCPVRSATSCLNGGINLNLGKKTISLFVGYSFCLFMSTYYDFFLTLYAPLIIATIILPFILKFPNSLSLNILTAIATAIPISSLLINLVPAEHLPDLNLGFYHLTKLETTTICISMILTKLPYINLKWIRGVAKNALFASSFLILLTLLSVQYVPDGYGPIIYVVIPFLLPMIYHAAIGKMKLFRTLAIAILTYTAAIGLDYYFLTETKDKAIMIEGNFPGFLIMDYLIPISFGVTLFLGYNPSDPLFGKNKNKVAGEGDSGTDSSDDHSSDTEDSNKQDTSGNNDEKAETAQAT